MTRVFALKKNHSFLQVSSLVTEEADKHVERSLHGWRNVLNEWLQVIADIFCVDFYVFTEENNVHSHDRDKSRDPFCFAMPHINLVPINIIIINQLRCLNQSPN